MIKVKCSGCGNDFNIFPYQLKTTQKFFCKFECRKGVSIHKKIKPQICVQCGVNKVKRRGVRKVRFCSRICCGNYHKKDFIIKKGYKRILKKDHPRTDGKGYVREHILVMENKIGRKLKDKEVVHHIDGNKLNNNPDNLMLFSNNAEHIKYHKLIKNIS